MTTAELLDYLQVTKSTLYTWRSSGRGPRAFSVGKNLRFRRNEVDSWLETQVAA
ncbi:helix-turn-helix domain-containing protein [Cryobacterium sp. TMT1-1]